MQSTDRIVDMILSEPKWVKKLHGLLDARIQYHGDKVKQSGTTKEHENQEQVKKELSEVATSVSQTVEDMTSMKQAIETVDDKESQLETEVSQLRATVMKLSNELEAEHKELETQEKALETQKEMLEIQRKLLEAQSQELETRKKAYEAVLKSVDKTQRDLQEHNNQQHSVENSKRESENKPPPFSSLVDPDKLSDRKKENARRLKIVKTSFNHAWSNYKKHAWGHDELQAKTGKPKDWAGLGFGMSIIEALGTLHLMGMKDDFEKGVDYLEKHLRFDREGDVSVFETCIRVLGGVLSVYELSGGKHSKHQILLEKARQLGDKLITAFDTPSGYPHGTINFKTGRHFGLGWTAGSSVLAELGTQQLEYRTLSYYTGNWTYDKIATAAVTKLRAKLGADKKKHLPYTTIAHVDGEWTSDHITIGGRADSFYEYLLKSYLMTSQTEPYWLSYFKDMATMIEEELLAYSTPSGYMYLMQQKLGQERHEMDHLACFAGGMFGHAASVVRNIDDDTRNRWMKIGDGIGDTCHYLYVSTPTGLPPEIALFSDGKDGEPKNKKYLLRPEAVETWFYMWRATHDQKWRDYGWDMMRALNMWCKTGYGYAGVKDVSVLPPTNDDLMQSFFLSETMKYLYLLFAPDDAFDLQEWVFNTEAHPLKIDKGKRPKREKTTPNKKPRTNSAVDTGSVYNKKISLQDVKSITGGDSTTKGQPEKTGNLATSQRHKLRAHNTQ